MKRLIMFRGKTVFDGTWRKGDLIGASSDFKDVVFIRCSYSDVCKVDPATVGQHIGMTDCEGREIFEDDIIRWAELSTYNCYLESKEYPEEYDGCSFDDLWHYGVVTYASAFGYPAFELSGWDEDECNGLSSLDASGEWHFEVAGNVHDNPELLQLIK